MDDLILKHALHNAVKFDGKANQGAVIGKVFGEKPELKNDASSLAKKVAEIVKKVNSMNLGEQLKKLKEIAPELLEEKKEKKKRELPELKNAIKGKVTTRLAPEPSKYLHIGHAFSFIINYLFAKKYEGKCILRFDDTNPEKASKEYYKAIESDLEWLGIKYDGKIIASNDMEKFYSYAEKLIVSKNAYVCFCSQESIHKNREEMKICDCRESSVNDNLTNWEKMKSGKLKEGKCILRLVGFMESLNAVMRDPVLFRLIKAKHPLQKTKYKLWPMYDFETVVEEELCNITHIMRSHEFGGMRIELQDYIKQLLGFKKQEVFQYSRLNVTGAVTQGREVRELIDSGKILGWDDPRLVTLSALRRRGIQPETLFGLAMEVGLTSSEKSIDWSLISSISRKFLDGKVNRYSFVDNPKLLVIDDAPKILAKAPLHPDDKARGFRRLKTNGRFFISDSLDLNKNYRLMHLFNFNGNKFLSQHLDPSLSARLIHWLPEDGNIEAEILMPDATVKSGLVEKNAKKIKVDEVVQFERFGFVRLDKKTKDKFYFRYTHD